MENRRADWRVSYKISTKHLFRTKVIRSFESGKKSGGPGAVWPKLVRLPLPTYLRGGWAPEIWKFYLVTRTCNEAAADSYSAAGHHCQDFSIYCLTKHPVLTDLEKLPSGLPRDWSKSTENAVATLGCLYYGRAILQDSRVLFGRYDFLLLFVNHRKLCLLRRGENRYSNFTLATVSRSWKSWL